ncbi:phage baseplate protein [Rhodanobacter sp. B04]|uniref:baseplate J/gp47 family protein n=1 Tax=Rhodanobacter sp. B04 TaxID=1945860 RepID=UPI000987D462|nr:baseplate J/gp47 family protein [Rhodanobacter sp. B04]OOG61456.1 phage baseplate protein [Rhodanobacter sp. B04]
MPFSRPTLSTLRAQVAADINSNIPGADGLLRFSNLGVLGTSLAGLANLHYGYLDYIGLQSIPYTAIEEALEAWAALKNIYREAAQASICATVTFQGSSGTINAGTPILRSDGTAYTATGSATVSGSSVSVPIVATVAGSAGNSPAGVLMTLGTPIAGIQSTGVATTAITGGTDQETDDSLRARMLQAFQTPPEGGSVSDYLTWALAVPGVTRAWCNPNGFGSGTVVVYIMLDAANALEGGFPQGTDGGSPMDSRFIAPAIATGDQLTVANAIYPQQPVTAMVYVCAPVANPINFEISGLSSSSTATRNAIAAAISEVFLNDGQPANGTIVQLSDIESAIASISGTSGFVIISPVGNIPNQIGQLPTLGTVTYL